MKTTEQVKKVIAEYPRASTDVKELVRLQEFFAKMKDAGIAKTREYDIPQPDTLGRVIIEKPRKAS
jgi:hypothetical protein